ncbi:MAG: response regulator [Silicimonas sp.]|jgi:CheY-like chemotaxis protein|nr:response regulator [Silicimonas sp.]
MTKPMNILLVEDNDLDVEILERGLRKMGASGALVRTRDGVEALTLLREDARKQRLPRPFVIMLDINMPRMNGHEFLETLRGDDAVRDARVFVFTTSDSKKDVCQAYRNNANGYIVKPNSSSELQDVLSALQNFWSACENPV